MSRTQQVCPPFKHHVGLMGAVGWGNPGLKSLLNAEFWAERSHPKMGHKVFKSLSVSPVSK